MDPQYRNELTKDFNDILLIVISFLFSFSMIIITISDMDSESFETFAKDKNGNIEFDLNGVPVTNSKGYNGLKSNAFLRLCFRMFEMNVFIFLWVFLFYVSWKLCFSWIFVQILFYSFLYFNNSKPRLIKYDTHLIKHFPRVYMPPPPAIFDSPPVSSENVNDNFNMISNTALSYETFDENSKNFHEKINFDRSFLFQNDMTNIVLSILLHTTLFKHSYSHNQITYWCLFYTKLNFFPCFSKSFSNPDYVAGYLMDKKFELQTKNIGCYFVKQVYFLRFCVAFVMYVSGVVLFFISKKQSLFILIFVSIWLIVNFLSFYTIFGIINHDFSKKFRAASAFNPTTAIQTDNLNMAWELICLGEPRDVKIEGIENTISLGLYYAGNSNDPKRVMIALKDLWNHTDSL